MTRRGRAHPLSLAPMMDRTDRHFRSFLRCITRHALTYTEMVTTGAVLHGDRGRLLDFDPDEKPIALQLGGDEPEALAACTRIAHDMGYDEVNLNVGCPSERVQQGSFGACLMAEPGKVRDAVAAMRAAVPLPITVKHRIGIDQLDRYEDLLRFVDVVAEAGCDRYAVHARIAWLKGLSPKENRDVPPLRYGDVYRLKRERPQRSIEINGGIRSLDDAARHLAHVDGVMIGRAAWDDPYLFARADRRFYDASGPVRTRHEVARAFLPYIASQRAAGVPLSHLTRGMIHLFHGCPGARGWRRALSEETRAEGAGADVVARALERVPMAEPGRSDRDFDGVSDDPHGE